MEDATLDDREKLLRFLDPRGNHVASNPDGTRRVASIAFLNKRALADATLGVSVFAESSSNMVTLQKYFQIHGLAHVAVGHVLECGFTLCPDPSGELPTETHYLIRPQISWSWSQYKAKGAALAERAFIMYLPDAYNH